MVKKKKITKQEKIWIRYFLIGAVAWAFLGEPIVQIINQIFPNNLTKLVVGSVVIGGIFWWSK